MPAGNAIELFNCSLCSFCETSLDRLSCHIRQHIKPDPCETVSSPSPKENIVTPRGYHNGDSTTNDTDSTNLVNGEVSTVGVFAKKVSELKQQQKQRYIMSASVQNEDLLSSRIEIVNPRTLNSNIARADMASLINTQRPPSAKQFSKGGYYPPPPPLVEKAPHINLYSTSMAPQHSLKPTNSTFMQQGRRDGQQPQSRRPENPMTQTRYVPLQPREVGPHQPHHELKSNRMFISQPYPAPHVNGKGQYVTDYVPIAPAKGGGGGENYRDSPTAPLELHISTSDAYRRSLPNSQDISGTVNTQKSIGVISPPNQRTAQIVATDNRLRLNQHYEPIHQHYNYPPVRVTKQYDDLYLGNVLHHKQQQNLRPAHYQMQKPLPPPQNVHIQRGQYQQVSNQHMEHISPDPRQPNPSLQSKISGIHYGNIKKQSQVNSVGIPNKGTIILNPEQLLSATGNMPLDQLSGLLIVPLKKTANACTQTDPVDISIKENNKSNVSASAQTELRMSQISDKMITKMPVTLFGEVRSTDSLFECLVCGEELASDHHLQEHISQNHTHVCEKCYHTSTNLSEHKSHVQECGNLCAEMLCMECNISFTSLKKFNQHRCKVHNVRMPFRCGICNVPFETHEAVMKHIATHDSDSPEFKCRYCVKVFQSPEALGVHVVRHKTVAVEHECRFCKKAFGSNSILQDHISYYHVITESEDHTNSDVQFKEPSLGKPPSHNPGNSLKKHCLCRHCDLAFKNRELLRRHTDICSKNPDAKASTFICDVCKEYFSSDIYRKQHLKQDHRRANGYRCPKCSKIYRTWSRLKFHTKQQHLKKTCSECNMVFTKEHILRKHQEDVHGKPQGQPGERVYTCSLCNTMLNTLTELMNHRRDVHPELSSLKNTEQPTMSSPTMLGVVDDLKEAADDTALSVSKCLECSEIFTSTKLMNDHIQTKHGATAKYHFKCFSCNLTFDDEKRLKNHRGLKHGERPFDCTECDKKFQYSSQVIWHMRCHNNRNGNWKSGNRPSNALWKTKSRFSSIHSKVSQNYTCQFCGAKFKQEKLLKNHKGNVHKIKLFSCEICEMKFGHSTELIWHLRTCRAKFKRENPGIDLPSEGKQAEGSDDGNDYNQDDFAPTMTNAKYNNLDDIESDENSAESNDRISMTRLKSPDSSHLQLSSSDAEELLKNEPQFDSSIGEYSCPICQKTTKSVTGMKTHYGRCHGVWGKETSHREDEGRQITVFPCKHCESEYKSFDELQSHTSSEHNIMITFDEVDVEIRQEPLLDDHRYLLYTCPHCHISFDNSKAIRVHAFKKHGILLNDAELNEWKSEKDFGDNVDAPVPHTSTEQVRYKCRHCKAKFRNTKAIRIHTFKAHGFILSKKELSRSKQHISNQINNPPVNRHKGRDLIDEPNPCDKCGRVFGNYRALFTHYRQAHRMMNENFVPRKPSRTELPSTFVSPDKKENFDVDSMPQYSSEFSTSPSSGKIKTTADFVDCPKCDRSFTVHKSLVAHLYSAHKISKEQYADYWPEGVPVLPRVSSNCPTCDKECVDARAMRIHMYKAHGMHYRDLNTNNTDVEIEDEDQNQSGDVLIGDETKLSVDVDIHGPPVCFICGRLFKGRRALMTHEHKFHGIRWVNLKRIFPHRVRNLPSSDKIRTPKAFDDSIATMSHSNNADTAVHIRATVTTPVGGFLCPECDARYQNRRAMTTHLCRIHKYKKDDIHVYFNIKPASGGNGDEMKAPSDIDNQSDNCDNLVIDETADDGSKDDDFVNFDTFAPVIDGDVADDTSGGDAKDDVEISKSNDFDDDNTIASPKNAISVEQQSKDPQRIIVEKD